MFLSKFTAGRSLAVLLFAAVFAAAPAQAQLTEPLSRPGVTLVSAGEISSIAYQADGSMLLAGNFTSINGVARDGLARLRPDGSLDPLWYPRAVWRLASPNYANRSIHALSDGSVLVLGDLNYINGQPAGGCGTKLSADPNPVAVSSWFQNAGCIPDSLAFDDQGWIYYVTGIYTVARVRADTGERDANWSGPTISYGRLIYDGNGGLIGRDGSYLRRVIIATGQIDPNWTYWMYWHPSQTTWASIADGVVDPVGGYVYVAFHDGHVAKLALANGQASPGSLWTAPHEPRALALGSGGELYVGGYPGVSRMSTTDGHILGSWGSDGDYKNVLALARRSDGAVACAGNFARLGATPIMGLALLEPAAQQPSELAQSEAPGFAVKLALQPGGGIIVSGKFDRADGLERKRLLRLKPDGLLDVGWAPRVDGFINALATDSNGDVYVGGMLDNIDGYSPPENLVKVDGVSGAVRQDYVPEIDNGVVQGLVVDANSHIYVSIASDSWIARRLRPEGSHDSNWGGLTTTGTRSGIQRVGNHIYVPMASGVGNLQLRRVPIATGTVDPDWSVALSPASGPVLVAEAADGDLLIGGAFASVNGVARRNLARVSSTVPVQVRAWDPSPDNSVMGVAVTPQGRVFASGIFSEIGGKPRVGNAELDPSDGTALDSWNTAMGSGEQLLTGDRLYLPASPRGVVAYRLDTDDSIFVTSFD